MVAELTELTGEAIKDSAWLQSCNNLPLASVCLGSFLESVRTLHKLVTAPITHSEQQNMHENPSVLVLTNNLRAQLGKCKRVLKILTPPLAPKLNSMHSINSEISGNGGGLRVAFETLQTVSSRGSSAASSPTGGSGGVFKQKQPGSGSGNNNLRAHLVLQRERRNKLRCHS